MSESRSFLINVLARLHAGGNFCLYNFTVGFIRDCQGLFAHRPLCHFHSPITLPRAINARLCVIITNHDLVMASEVIGRIILFNGSQCLIRVANPIIIKHAVSLMVILVFTSSRLNNDSI